MSTIGEEKSEQKRKEDREKELEARKKKLEFKERMDNEKANKKIKQIADARKKAGLEPLRFGREPEHILPKVPNNEK